MMKSGLDGFDGYVNSAYAKYPQGKFSHNVNWQRSIYDHNNNVVYDLTPEMLNLVKNMFGDLCVEWVRNTNQRRIHNRFSDAMQVIVGDNEMTRRNAEVKTD